MICLLIAGVALSSSALAQDDERTKRILERIDKEIRESHAKLLEDLRQIIRSELGGKGVQTPLPAPSPAKKAYLGIGLDDLTDEERNGLGITGGVKIGDVKSGGPADKAGLKPGDIVVDLDGEGVTEDKLADLIGRHKPGEAIDVTVFRAKKKQSIKVVLGGR